MIRTTISGSRKSGKTTELVKRIRKASKQEDRKILVISPNMAMSKNLYDKLLLELPSKKIRRSIVSPPSEINLNNGTDIRFYTAIPNALSGSHVDDLFVDEVTLINEGQLNAMYSLATETITETRLVHNVKQAGAGVLE